MTPDIVTGAETRCNHPRCRRRTTDDYCERHPDHTPAFAEGGDE